MNLLNIEMRERCWGEGERDKREIVILLDNIFFNFFSLSSGIIMMLKRIYFYFSCLIAAMLCSISKFVLETLIIRENVSCPWNI